MTVVWHALAPEALVHRVLIVAAIVSGLLQEWVDSAAILAIVILNAVLGFVQEFKAEKSLAALKKLSIATARVAREGVVRSIPARGLIPDDVIQVEAGDQYSISSIVGMIGSRSFHLASGRTGRYSGQQMGPRFFRQLSS
jgi:magnesium-transporting ATPase (P-type)